MINFSTKTQLHRMDNQIHFLKNVLQNLRITKILSDFTALKTADDFMMAESSLKCDKLQLEYVVQQLKNFDAEWQNLILTTRRGESDAKAYLSKYFDENGVLAILNEADAQLFNICSTMAHVFIKKSNGTVTPPIQTHLIFNHFKHVSIIPDLPKISTTINHSVGDKNEKNYEAVNTPPQSLPVPDITQANLPTIISVSPDANEIPVTANISENITTNYLFANAGQHYTVNIVISSTVTTTAVSCNLKIPDRIIVKIPVIAACDLDLIKTFIAKFEAAICPVEHQNVHFSCSWEIDLQHELSFIEKFLQLPEIAQLLLLKMLCLMFACIKTTFGCSFMPISHATAVFTTTFGCSLIDICYSFLVDPQCSYQFT